MTVTLMRARNSKHKFVAIFPNGSAVHFGLRGYSDYTIHKDPERMRRYLMRHAGSRSGLRSRRENWTKSGAKTAGFWSRWILWSKPSLKAAIKQTEKVLGQKILIR